MKKLLALGALILAVGLSQSLAQSNTLFLQDAPDMNIQMAPEDILLPDAYRPLKLDQTVLEGQLKLIGNGTEMSFPMPDGSLQRFWMTPSQVMAPELAAKFPEIKTYRGRGMDNPTSTMVMDFSPKGLHIMIMGEEGTTFINPLHHQADGDYLSFYKRDARRNPEYADGICSTPVREGEHELDATRDVPLAVGDNLVRYRIAIASSANYTAYHGGTVSDALAAITTALNRINGVYERDFAITLELVADNDQLVYIGSDPFFSTPATVGNNLTFLTDTIANRIGFNSFDVGHLFTRIPPQGGVFVAGIAFRGVVCTNLKGAGISTLPDPVGDPFVIEVAAHEMGHQFNSPHCYNTNVSGICFDQRTASNAYQPGGGTTIMCYAGTCAPHNIQNNTDVYFHSGSRDFIIDYTRTGNGSNCSTVIPNNNNNIPVVTVPAGGFFIPHSTPFELDGSATDADGDALTYCWEEMDLGPAGSPDFPVGNAPIFRTFTPTSATNRVFPLLGSIINNNTVFGELLPTYGRDLTFHLTARDGNGGVGVGEVGFKVAAGAGPFLVTQPNSFQVYEAESYLNVTWDVANTDQVPVNTAEVDIFMSTDGGLTYPIQLADNVPNDGEQVVLLPNAIGNFNRMRVQAADNIFFDISNTNFGIQQVDPGFSMFQVNDVAASCPGGLDASYTIITSSQAGFTDSIDFLALNLPPGVVATFTPALIAPGDTCVMTLNVTTPLPTGTYDFFIRGFAGAVTSPQFDYTLEILDGQAPPVAALNPMNGDPGASINPVFTWEPIPGALSYDFVVGSSADFVNPITVQTGLTTTSYSLPLSLLPEEVYYWRVVAYNICGPSPQAVFAFKTGVCSDFTSTDVPKVIPLFGSPAVVTSTLNISTLGDITDVNVVGLQGTHSEVNDLEFELTSPSGTTVLLFSGICNDGIEDFNLSLDDGAADSVITCPPTSGGVFRPEESLSAFNGENPNGTWTLTVRDLESFEDGNLTGWGLEVCTSLNNPPSLLTNNPLNINRWEQGDIGQSLLNASDPLGPASTIFTLISLPSNGGVLLNGTNIFPGATFTQEDINNGNLAYIHNGDSIDSNDAFTFTVSNPNGGWLGTPAFQINITQTTSLSPQLELPDVQVYPNPVRERLFVQMETPTTPSAWTVDVLTLQGQILARKEGGAREALNTSFNMRDLAAGLYLVRVQTAQGQKLVKVSVR